LTIVIHPKFPWRLSVHELDSPIFVYSAVRVVVAVGAVAVGVVAAVAVVAAAAVLGV
jgi:hypothetical protein